MPWTWSDAAKRWLTETAHKRSSRDDLRYSRWLEQHWQDRQLDTIKAADICHIAELKKNESSPATANRHLAFIRAILRRAHREWEWIDKAPFIRLYPEKARRVRWISPDQARHLLDQLPEHSRHAVIFALSTGLRHANVVGLTWQQVDVKRRVAWLFADQTKNGDDLQVPLNDVALSVLKLRQHLHDKYVFTYRGKPVKRLNTTAWLSALDRAGIENFRWHDLRHTWASWLVQEGVPLYALQELGGWKTAGMVRKYAHLSPAQNLGYACKIDSHLRGAS